MSALGHLTLYFEQHRDRQVKLARTAFKRSKVEDALEAERGSYAGMFKWSSAVKAMMVLLLRSAAEAVRQSEESPEGASPYVLSGARPSIAASVNDALTKRPLWVYDVFGTVSGELPMASEIVKRRNPDFSVDPSNDVELWLDQEVFPGSRVEVILNGRRLTDEREVDQLAEAVALQWTPRHTNKAAADPPKLASSNPELVAEAFQKLSAAEPGPDTVQQHLELLFEMVAEDCKYRRNASPEMNISGQWHGKLEVVKAASVLLSEFENVDSRVNALTSESNVIGVFMEDSAISVRNGQPVTLNGSYSFTFREGKIVNVDHLLIVD